MDNWDKQTDIGTNNYNRTDIRMDDWNKQTNMRTDNYKRTEKRLNEK